MRESLTIPIQYPRILYPFILLYLLPNVLFQIPEFLNELIYFAICVGKLEWNYSTKYRCYIKKNFYASDFPPSFWHTANNSIFFFYKRCLLLINHWRKKYLVFNQNLLLLRLTHISQRGRSHWTLNYTGPQSFITSKTFGTEFWLVCSKIGR